MALWLIRSRNAEDEAAALKHGLAIIGFTDVAVYTASLQEWAADPANPLEVAPDLDQTKQ